MATVKTGQLGELPEREYAERADPNAKSTALVKAPKIEEHLIRGLVTLTQTEAEDALDGAEYLDKQDRKRLEAAVGALQEGRQLVDLRTVVRQAWVEAGKNRDESSHLDRIPPVALAPATAKRVRVIRNRSGEVSFDTQTGRIGNPWALHLGPISAPWSPTHGERTTGPWAPTTRWARADTPRVPGKVLKIVGGKKGLAGKLLFWEAAWYDLHLHTAAPPQRQRRYVLDPALLEPVAGMLYSVQATWDLTEVEAAALR